MDSEELSKLCESLYLDEDVTDTVELNGDLERKGEEMVAACLIGKVLANKALNREAFIGAVNQHWKLTREVKVESMGNNIFIFKFSSEVDRRRVMEGGPGHFNNALIVLSKLVGNGEVTKQSFKYKSSWIQLLNVPVMCVNDEMAWELGSRDGKVKEMDPNGNSEMLGKFLRIMVQVDITKPLKKGVIVDRPDTKEKTVLPTRYEKLLEFCFQCGCLGHFFRLWRVH